MKKEYFIIYFLVFLLTIWGGWRLVQTWEKESLWIPRTSFYVPKFMFETTSTSLLPSISKQTDLPVPTGSSDNLESSMNYVFHTTPLSVIKADQPLLKETTAAVKYRKPIKKHPDKKQIALIISPLGLNKQVTEKVLSSLPDLVTLSYSSKAPNLTAQLEDARQKGFETMLNLPMETDDFPAYDPGEKAIYSFQDNITNQKIIENILSNYLPISGVLSQNTALIEKTPELKTLIEENISQKGLIYISSSKITLPLSRHVDLDVHDNLYPEAFHTYIQKLEKTALEKGSAIGIFSPAPVVLQTLAKWISENSSPDIEFVPVSTLLMEDKNDLSS